MRSTTKRCKNEVRQLIWDEPKWKTMTYNVGRRE